jgi:hypothetical protein
VLAATERSQAIGLLLLGLLLLGVGLMNVILIANVKRPPKRSSGKTTAVWIFGYGTAALGVAAIALGIAGFSQ